MYILKISKPQNEENLRTMSLKVYWVLQKKIVCLLLIINSKFTMGNCTHHFKMP